MSERCPHLGHPDDPDEYAPICRECYDELRAHCERLKTLARLIDDALKKLGPDAGEAFFAKYMRMEEALTRIRDIVDENQIIQTEIVLGWIDAALQDTEER